MADLLPARSKRLHKLYRRLSRSRFFTLSLLLHAALIFLVGGTVLFNKYVEPPDFTGEAGGGFVSAEQAAQRPAPAQPQLQQPMFTVTAPSNATAPTIAAITTAAAAQSAFSLPTIANPVVSAAAKTFSQAAAAVAPAATFSGGMSREIATGIATFTGGWSKGSTGLGTSIRSREFEFTAYLAKYSGGDWDSTVRQKGGKITAGSLPNLLFVIGKLTRDKINAHPDPVALDLSSEEMFAKKPPFIFFTGHRDFKLTDKEVANLQKYIRLGGCIWGDSSLPGERSRFDIAFRREMRRVVPDVDKKFEPLPPGHDLYNVAKIYYPEVHEPPAGINYYREPVYALKIFGEIAVLYTANDYGDMWQIGLTEKLEIDHRRNERKEYVALNPTLWNLRNTYIRNLEAPALAATYKFGTNVVIHLLTRWEDKVRNVPAGL
ncbi:MAG: DUF4159 domain-containing protein [Verrucomicrobiota bacterium]|nr:DUF4159 domain-containing protein [Verrucomicrobiota bacterium]